MSQTALEKAPDAASDVPSVVRGFQEWIGDVLLNEPTWEIVRCLEDLKNTLTARQADVTVALHRQQADEDVRRGFVNPSHTDRLVAAQLGLARRRSPVQAGRLLRIAHLTVASEPVREAMRTGELNEEQAGIIRRETDGLVPEDRDLVIERVSETFGRTSDRHLADDVRSAAHRVDPELAARRAEAARADRHVSLRAARDGMAHLSAFLPAVEGRACLEALRKSATTAKREPRPDWEPVRTHRQWTADLLVQRISGRDPLTQPVDVTVNLLVPIDALTSGKEPGYLPGYGPLPAGEVREVLSQHEDGIDVRRLFVHPATGQLVGMESRSRFFRGLLREFVRWRDRRCRTPWCGAAITEIDHITSHAKGGPTSASNAEGDCQHCNLVKEHPAWQVTGTASEVLVSSGGLEASTRPPAACQPSQTWSPYEQYLVDLEWSWAIRRAAGGDDP
ncbi:HNH endonuclease signature motif containing protein [Branchiibius sp. NY16-3462-2]|uniref:HNH endonuclease n=1 Tax=Branchiibius sp. NY16-3462-2 TaxID=1807500 RepID=UPI0007946CCC|nr:HNH endonuclease signature motif containing protein [Branchiibius sp. NY16-3462-2]KYH44546.1 hypothetical protein AZH51_08570 [Branchiibius sp. NY16-3462-2]